MEIQKAETEDHPCRLEKTTVKIQFPDMRSEVFVNFLGYKEPNLMYLMRCKGRCRDGTGQEAEEANQIACFPTKVGRLAGQSDHVFSYQGRESGGPIRSRVFLPR